MDFNFLFNSKVEFLSKIFCKFQIFIFRKFSPSFYQIKKPENNNFLGKGPNF